jgi:hypothetical protein
MQSSKPTLVVVRSQIVKFVNVTNLSEKSVKRFYAFETLNYTGKDTKPLKTIAGLGGR